MKKRWLAAAVLVAGAACAETTPKDIDRNKSGNVAPSNAGTTPPSKLAAEASDQIDDNTYVVECDTQKEGMAP